MVNPTEEKKEDLISEFTDATQCSSREEARQCLERHNWDIDKAVVAFIDENSPTTKEEEKERKMYAFTEIKSSSSREEAQLYLQSHEWDLPKAVEAFTQNKNVEQNLRRSPNPVGSVSSFDDTSRYYLGESSRSPSPGRLRSRSASPPNDARYPLRAADNDNENSSGSDQRLLNPLRAADNSPESQSRGVSGTDNDYGEDNENSNGSDQSGSMGQEADAERVSRSTLRRLSEFLVDVTQYQLEQVHRTFTYTISIWRNGFTVGGGPLLTLDDQENAFFLQSIQELDPPRELNPGDDMISVLVNLIRREEEDHPESAKPFVPFQGVGRRLGTGNSPSAEPPAPPVGLVVNPAEPTTSIKIRLADGTHIDSQFNTHHTIGDIQDFIDESRPGEPTNYNLRTMGFPTVLLDDPNQTIEDAGIANSLLIQKF